MVISNLPTEIIEYVLLHAVMAGEPQAISSFAQTCRFLRNLVYDPVDQHLWREVFLLEFDDPRLSAASIITTEFDWGHEFRRRFKAGNLVLRLSRSNFEIPFPAAIDPLLSIISTSLSLNTSVSVDDPHAATSASFTNPRDNKSSHPSYPIFPAATRFGGDGSEEFSRNTKWLERVLSNGYSAEVARRLISGSAHDLERDDYRRLYKLLCCTGFPAFCDVDGDRKARDLEVHQRLRQWAKNKVYNIRYMERDRHWGPFLPVHPRTSVGLQQQFDEVGISEEDLVVAFQNQVFGLGIRRTEGRSSSVPRPEQLYVDWEYLFGVRKVVETNLKEVIVGGKADEVLKGLTGLEGLRAGTAPGAKRPSFNAAKGWDWAGVEGIWRRCICWMDYRDLILNNINLASPRFSDAGLGEAIRIIPVRLRVVSYSVAPKEWPDRPTIHVEGEQGGPLGSSNIRKVRGTVCMTGDGEVRYNLYTRKADDRDDEWVTEGIQIGNVGSAMGILGVWTGAKHERSDPLGPFWAWKMA